eukprot:64207-Prymnesium_polylepis.1
MAMLRWRAVGASASREASSPGRAGRKWYAWKRRFPLACTWMKARLASEWCDSRLTRSTPYLERMPVPLKRTAVMFSRRV